MRHLDKPAAKACRTLIIHALLILPAVVLGVLAMIHGGVSPALWAQQAAAWTVLFLLAEPLRRAARRISAAAWSVLFLIFLAATLFGEEVGGARRWVNLVVFHANAAMLVLPALLTVLYRMRSPYPFLLGAALVLCLQPDLSQLAALSAAALVLLYQRREKLLWRIGCVLLLFALIIRCSLVPTAIEPASYCEGILAMLGDMSVLLPAVGVITLAAIPAYFARLFLKQKQTQMLSLAVYYAVTLLFILTGDCPVPFMGFGLSPIAGYWLAYIAGAFSSDQEHSAAI